MKKLFLKLLKFKINILKKIYKWIGVEKRSGGDRRAPVTSNRSKSTQKRKHTRRK